MKIAFVVPGFSSHERDWCIPALLDFVRVLSQRVELHVFTLRWPERLDTYPVYGAVVHALDGREHLGLRAPGLWMRALRAISAEHGRGPFDALHGIWADEAGWIAACASRLLGVPAVVSLAGGELVALPDIAYGLLRLPGRRQMVRWTLGQAARVAVGSAYMKALASAHCDGRRLVYLPLGVDTQRFVPRSRASQAGTAPVLINVAALTPVKDHALLLRVFRRAARALPEAGLQLAGEGPLQAEVARMARGLRVHFLGQVDHGHLPDLYRQASLYVQTSRHEAQGMALLEAAACGVPAVGTPVGVLPEIGLAARTESELAQQIIEVLSDEPRGRALGETARAKVVAEYALDVAAGRMLEVYQGMAAGWGPEAPVDARVQGARKRA